ncbi:MAG: outer membrane protein assembly factor BamD [Bacteroidota bacterium]
MVIRIVSAVAFLAVLVGAAGCGSGEQVTNLSVEDRFARAKAMFEKEDYLDAINEFTVITLQNQGSQFAADAQYYLGECRYQRGEYLLAAFEFGIMKRSYPTSPRAAEAQYKLAMSYYHLSPKSSLDQQYTRRAIDEFQTFIEYYPSNPLAADADAKIKELNTKLAKKLYDAARQYVTLERYKAALRYFDDVIEQYHDTDYAPLAYLDKAELLLERKRYAEAGTELSRFLQRFPNSVLRARADALKRRLEEESRRSPASGQSGGGPLTSGSLTGWSH